MGYQVSERVRLGVRTYNNRFVLLCSDLFHFLFVIFAILLRVGFFRLRDSSFDLVVDYVELRSDFLNLCLTIRCFFSCVARFLEASDVAEVCQETF